jgi:hypothetical protein
MALRVEDLGVGIAPVLRADGWWATIATTMRVIAAM